MSLRSQRYIIRPERACPSGLRQPNGCPQPTVSLDIAAVQRSAWSEILQTAPRGNSLFAFFEDLLEPGSNLIWREAGPGLGTEMRRSFSGLFGRFFARAYLEGHHDFRWFAAIDGDDFNLSPRWRIRKKPGSKTEMPDWICAQPGALAIAEAKGSHQKGDATRAGEPGPIKTAKGQIEGVQVQKGFPARAGLRWRAKSVKGWAVMSRWGTSSPARSPFLFALDPDTEGEPLTADEINDLVQAVARKHIEQISIGLGLLRRTDPNTTVPTSARRVRVANDSQDRQFAGTVLTPFGALDLPLDRVSELTKLLPNPDLVRFVGLENSMFSAYLQGGDLKPRNREQLGESSSIGGDGLLMASISDLIEQKDSDS